MRLFLLASAFILIQTLLIAQPVTEKLRKFEVKESNTKWEALIDTTSELTLIHAERVTVSNAGPDLAKNVGNPMSFKLMNANGEGRTVNSRASGLATINGQTYYTAILELGLFAETEIIWKKVTAVLMDRAKEDYRLVVGKNFTEGTVRVKD